MKLSEGAGVQIRRTVGTPMLRNLDPFLMLDELKLPVNQATAGFPDHPHRGFETCTIMMEGEMQHKDSAGNKGVIGPGGVQWMTAGRGIIHSEMPVSREGRLWGFQLWINLPKQYKMMKPRYQDYQCSDIPSVQGPGSKVRVMAGQLQGVTEHLLQEGSARCDGCFSYFPLLQAAGTAQASNIFCENITRLDVGGLTFDDLHKLVQDKGFMKYEEPPEDFEQLEDFPDGLEEAAAEEQELASDPDQQL
eukprot:gene12007-12151_t